MDATKNKRIGDFLPNATAGFILCMALALASAPAAAVNISQAPLIVGQIVDPNIMLTLDDSGSMQFEFMPENPLSTQGVSIRYMYPIPSTDVYGNSGYSDVMPTFKADDVVNAFFRSSSNNKIYYNPKVTYAPWSNPDGSSKAPADPSAAYWNPGNTGAGTYDLTEQKKNVNDDWAQSGTDSINPIDVDCGTDNDNHCDGSTSEDFWPMVYWVYKDNGNDKYDIKNYVRIELRGSSGSNHFAITKYDPSTSSMVVDTSVKKEEVGAITGVTREYHEAVQNFANWFQYYRSRALLAKAGVGTAFAEQGTNLRVGFTTINSRSPDIVLGVRQFSDNDRDTFFSTLYGQEIPTKGTPLRESMSRVGLYFMDADGDDSPWNNTPGEYDTDSEQLACRQNYNVLTTDGYWNGGEPDIHGVDVDDEDGDDGKNTPVVYGPGSQSYEYVPQPPFEDEWEETLADVAMYYWSRDLRDDMPNIVATSSEDPAFWQHMVNFTVGLGVFGSLTKDDLPELRDGTKDWPDPIENEKSARIDDLFHAAVNSRGKFFSAASPVEFANALSQTLSAIVSRIGSAASAATNTGLAVPGETQIFKPLYHSGSWSGDLIAYDFDVDTLLLAPTTHAQAKLDAQDWSSGRNIITMKATPSATAGGVAFTWDDISSQQQTALDQSDGSGEDRLQYVRGKTALEGTTFRDRAAILGDIIHSTPVYIGSPGALLRMEGYAAFRVAHATRPAMIYVGANDGMLHAFAADTLEEKLAYVPAGVYGNLYRLTDKDYSHHYFVDGTPTIADVDFDDTNNDGAYNWHTVLVGTTAAGGKSVFALDVTDPGSTYNNFTEAKASDIVLWEIGPTLDADSSDGTEKYADLGYTFSRPAVVKMNSGQWVAIFGNGYDSDNGKAVLYIADIEDGSLIKKFELASGSDNGLSTPVAIDVNNDKMADRIYAGDLHGDLWAIDVSSSNDNDWKVAFGNATNPKPLFDGDANHPITVRPAVVRNPEGGQVVLFGTGKFFEAGDATVDTSTEPVQSFYGIWDSSAVAATVPVQASDLVEQDIIQLDAGNGNIVRIVEKNTVDYSSSVPAQGWRIRFDVPAPLHNGEKITRAPLLRPNKLIFTTMIPSNNPCAGGGTGWLMEVDPLTGGRLAFSAFDMNGDGKFDKNDYVEIDNPFGQGKIKVPISGIRPTVGVPTRPAIVIDPDSGNEYKFITGSTGNSAVVPNNAGPGLVIGRQSWHQLK